MSHHLYFSLTQHLLSNSTDELKAATQSPFLLTAAQGRVDKETLRTWLVNDRQYIHAYIQGAEGMIASIQQPPEGSSDTAGGTVDESEAELVVWLTEAIANVRREEQFFVDVAARYGIDLEPRPDDGELRSLIVFETLFRYIPPTRDQMMASCVR
jgi:thiaminase